MPKIDPSLLLSLLFGPPAAREISNGKEGEERRRREKEKRREGKDKKKGRQEMGVDKYLAYTILVVLYWAVSCGKVALSAPEIQLQLGQRALETKQEERREGEREGIEGERGYRRYRGRGRDMRGRGNGRDKRL